jgi:hypothetical protein
MSLESLPSFFAILEILGPMYLENIMVSKIVIGATHMNKPSKLCDMYLNGKEVINGSIIMPRSGANAPKQIAVPSIHLGYFILISNVGV